MIKKYMDMVFGEYQEKAERMRNDNVETFVLSSDVETGDPKKPRWVFYAVDRDAMKEGAEYVLKRSGKTLLAKEGEIGNRYRI